MTQSLSQRAIRNGFTHMLAMAVNIATGFVVTPAVIAGIGITQFGIWAIATLLVGYSSILDFGLGQTLIKKTSELLAKDERGKLDETVGVVLTLYLLIAGAIFIIFSIVVCLAPTIFDVPANLVPILRETLIVLGLVATAGFPLSIFGGLIGGLQDFYVINFVGAILNLVKMAGTLVLLSMGHGLISLVILGAAASAIGWALNYAWLRHRLPDMQIRPVALRSAIFKDLAAFSLSMFIWSIAGQALVAIDRLIVAILLPIKFVGFYEVGARLNTYSRYAINVVFVVMPAASNLSALGKQTQLRRAYLQGTKLVLGAYALVATMVVMLGNEFVRLWIGPGFEGAAQVAQILVVASLFQSQNSLGHVMLVGMGKLRVFTKVMAAYPFTIVALCTSFGASLGMIGVASGVLATVIILEGIILLHLLAVLEVRLGEMVKSVHMKVALCMIGGGALLLALDRTELAGWYGLVIKACSAALLYAVLFIWVGLARDERREMVTRLARAFAVVR